MFERLKRALIENFVGAIALGYLLAQCILDFVNIFASPVASWIMRNEYRKVIPGGTALAGFSLRDGLPNLVRFLFLFLVWYFLVRWLYFTPLEKETSEPASSPEQAG
jgi:hypothetical protein